MVITDVCKYSFYRFLVPAGTKWLRIVFRNKNVYNSAQCRQVKVLLSLDSEQLDDLTPVNVGDVISFEDLNQQKTYLLSSVDDSVALTSGKLSLDRDHYLYVGVMTHVDEIDVQISVSEDLMGRAACYGVAEQEVSQGCSGSQECGEPSSSNTEQSIIGIFRRLQDRVCSLDHPENCETPERCADIGGIWLDDACYSSYPLQGSKYVICNSGSGTTAYVWSCTDKEVYRAGDKVVIRGKYPDFDRPVDVYVGYLNPAGELVLLYKKEGRIEERPYRDEADLVPLKENVEEHGSFYYELPVSYTTFSGDTVYRLIPGNYTLYMYIVPHEMFYTEDYILTECHFSVE